MRARFLLLLSVSLHLVLTCSPQFSRWHNSRRSYLRKWLLLATTKTSRDAREYGLAWTSWRRTHGKSYSSSSEELERYVVWRSNTAYIQSHNSYADKFGFTLTMNRFGDMVSKEIMR